MASVRRRRSLEQPTCRIAPLRRVPKGRSKAPQSDRNAAGLQAPPPPAGLAHRDQAAQQGPGNAIAPPVVTAAYQGSQGAKVGARWAPSGIPGNSIEPDGAYAFARALRRPNVPEKRCNTLCSPAGRPFKPLAPHQVEPARLDQPMARRLLGMPPGPFFTSRGPSYRRRPAYPPTQHEEVPPGIDEQLHPLVPGTRRGKPRTPRSGSLPR